MTGFGVGETALETGRLIVETRSVNHRFLDVRARMPRELSEHGAMLEQLARAKFSRGRIEISVRFDGVTQGAVALDRRRAVAAYRALEALRDELKITEAVPLALLSSVPDLFGSSLWTDYDGVREALTRALEAAVRGLESMREAEGAFLGKDIAARLKLVESRVADIAERAPGLPERYRRRLRERLARLIDGQDVALDPARLEQEVVLYADHADVSEELTRLASHALQFGEMLVSGEPVGRRLDFLLQEMGREINTIGSKANEAEIARHIVELKAEIEKMREQVQNVE